MSTPKSGRYCSFKVGATVVEGQSKWSINIKTEVKDAPEWTGSAVPAWKKKALTGLDWDGDVSGFLVPTGTGQQALAAAAIAGTLLDDVRFYYDVTNYFFPDTVTDSDAGCYISDYKVDADFGDVVKVSFKVTGNGPITYTEA